jgi:hypothetical protein
LKLKNKLLFVGKKISLHHTNFVWNKKKTNKIVWSAVSAQEIVRKIKLKTVK